MSVRYLLKEGYLRLRGMFMGLLFKPGKPTQIQPDQIRSITMIRVDRIGDMVASLPAIRSLKAVFPAAQLTVVAPASILPLLKNTPGIDRLLAYRGFWLTIRALRKERFSLMVDPLMDYTLKTALIAFFSRSGLTAGFDIAGRGRIFNIALKPEPGGKKMHEYLLDLIRAIAVLARRDSGFPADALPRIFLSEEDKVFAADLIKSAGINEGELVVGIAAGGKFPSQRWDIKNFAILAQRVSDKHKARIVLIGSAQERGSVEGLASLSALRPVLAVGLPLNKLAALISKMDLLICNNSGPLHIAAALGVPTVSTMGPTAPHLWHPAGERNIVIRRDLACSPCNKAACSRHECMGLITVKEMEDAAGVLIGKVGKL